MPFFYICSPCLTNDGKGLLVSTRDRGQVVECPYCRQKTAQFKRAYKNRTGDIKRAVTFENAGTQKGRSMRPKRRQLPARYMDGADGDTDIAQVMAAYDPQQDRGAEDDPEYVAQVDFRPDMRFTADGNRLTCRDPAVVIVVHAFQMDSVDHTITTSPGRGDTGTEMARVLPVRPLRVISAYTWANWQVIPPTRGLPYRSNKFYSLEWCHLIADSLGGATVSHNLVAASFAANTFMMTIEEKLNARSDLTIQVRALCSKDHVAEFVYYTVKRGTATNTWIIDGRNDIFSRADYLAIGQEVTNFIGARRVTF
jgi:DNA-directed RNA polymerase subunit RPC12/RpoP